jgi:hypothetical protein
VWKVKEKRSKKEKFIIVISNKNLISTNLKDANKNRSVEVFASIYNKLLQEYGPILSDSRIKSVLGKQVKIMDSTTISLFKDILKCVGRKPKSGKRKGGVKVHTVINADETLPNLVWFSSATTHDHQYLKMLKCDDNTIYVFDKGYNDYKAFEYFGSKGTGFVTRIKDNALYTTIDHHEIAVEIHSGVKEDTTITVNAKSDEGTTKPLQLRKITFYDREHKREFEFITNLMDIRADMIAALYKIRWQI